MSFVSGAVNLVFLRDALDASKLTGVIALLGTLIVVSSVIKLVQGIKAVGSLPGCRIPFSPFSAFGGLLPNMWWNPSFTFVWKWRKNQNLYHRFGRDTVSLVPFLSGSPTLSTQSLEVGRQILLGGLTAFDKSPDIKSPFLFWGPNIIDAYGEEWRKHRKLSSPAFGNDTHATVWDASYRLFEEMMTTQGWDSEDVIEVPSLHSVTFKFSLAIFTSVGFGMPLTWSKPSSQDNEPSVQECLDIVTKTIWLAMILPSWAWKLPFARIQSTRRAYDIVRTFMRSQINTIRENLRSEAANGNLNPCKDLLSLLVQASEDFGGKSRLSDEELIGDVFTFLLAGHDTTANGLAVALALLALDVDIQDEIASQARELTEERDGSPLLYEDYGKLDKVLAAYHEGLRMFPPGSMIVREARRDVFLDVSDTHEPRMLDVKKGTQIIIDLIGTHYNPKYFSEPEVYRPSRWFATKQGQNSDAKQSIDDFFGFGFGARACIGRKYSTTEAVCFLAHLLRDWRVEPLLAQHPNGELENVAEWRERVFKAEITLTLSVMDHGIRLVRRK